jgi:hypothetical protein
VSDGQLALFAESEEPDMTADELDAVRCELVARLGGESDETRTNGADRPKRCACERPLVFRDEFSDSRCSWCGREPR